MSEAKTSGQSSVRPMGLFGTAIAGLTTTVCVAIGAWCFLCVIWGVHSIHQHSVTAAFNQIDALLVVHTWVSAPAWINAVIAFYTQGHTVAMQPSSACFDGLSTLSHSLPQFKPSPATTAAANPFAKEFVQTCSVVKNQILPLFSGTTAVILLRLWSFITALPLFLLSLSIGLVDGLVQRDIRKFQGARESTLLFHRIKQGGAVIFFLPLFAYLAWLSPVAPVWFFVPMALAVGLWLALSVRFFKKYI